jgi:glycosyltransferase involved in cell wall biosynthesis
MPSICFIGDRNIYLKRICNYLAGQNYNVQLLCRHDHGINENEFDKRITIYTIRSNRLWRKLSEIRSFLKKGQPDFIHFQYLSKDILLSLFLKGRYRIIATPWGSDLNIFSDNIVNRIVINIGLICCDKIQIISEGIKKKFAERFRFIKSDKILEISWGIQYELFHQIDDEKLQYWRNRLEIELHDIVILSYRNHRPLYNHDTLIKSLPVVASKYPNLKCIFTRGNYDPDYLKNNKELVQQLNLQNRVIFIEEWIADDLLPSLIHMADIVVSIPMSDGLPATILEIMATHSIPVIGDLPEYTAFFKDGVNGRILKRIKDPEQLAGILTACIKDMPVLSDTYSGRNNEFVRNYQNWDLQKAKMMELYN